jgi:hypothetical protein
MSRVICSSAAFAGGDIRAWSIATDVRYTFVDLPLTPYIEMRA